MNIGNIVTGHLNEVLGLNKDLVKERMKICKICPLYSQRLGGVCNNRLWLNVKTGDISLEAKPGYNRGCGCRLQAKLTLSHERCPVGKW